MSTIPLAQVIMQGNDALKPSPVTKGRLYFAIDSATTYYDTETAWEPVSRAASTLISGNGSPSGVAEVQAITGAGDSLAFTNPVTSGNLLVVAFKTEGSPASITVTDTLGTAYTLAASVTGESNNLVVYTGTVPASGTNTVTIGSAPASYDRLAIMEVAGVGAIDATATLYNSAGTNPESLSVTTTVPNDFLLFVVAGFHNADTFTFGGGFALDAQAGGNDALAIGHKLGAAAGSYTANVNIAGGADNSPLIMIAFKPANTSTPGVDGDFYLDLTGKGLWGPRTGGAYSLVGTLN